MVFSLGAMSCLLRLTDTCSETVTDDYTTQTEYTEEDSYTDDDCSYSEESASGDIDELLEEALDDTADYDESETTDTEPTPAPRHKRPVGGEPSDRQGQVRAVFVITGDLDVF